ncbi:MAG: hypothetical protein ACJAVT_002267 [Yoonia sp.]|jgi:hypothetical protein
MQPVIAAMDQLVRVGVADLAELQARGKENFCLSK